MSQSLSTKAGQVQLDSGDRAIGGDAALQLERREKLRDAIHRSKLAGIRGDDPRPHVLEEIGGQSDAEICF